MTPRELIEKWIEIFNEGNADKIMELYHTDAINHQVANPPCQREKSYRSNVCC